MNISAHKTSIQILPTKLAVPSCGGDIVERERFETHLRQTENKSLVLIRAPAGYGKTTLAACWTKHWQGKVGWYSIEEADNDLTRFGYYLLTCLSRQLDGYDFDLETDLKQGHALDLVGQIEQLLMVLANSGEPLLLVLDDYHLVTNEEIHNVIKYLISHLPASAHILITSRSEPPLGLASLRVRNQVHEVTNEELSFTRQELSDFLSHRLPKEVKDATIEQMLDKTDGWAAGIQIMALSASRTENFDSHISQFSQSHAHILDFLVEEVLAKEPDDVREFLLATSVVQRFNSSLAASLTGNASCQQTIDYLRKTGLFLTSLDSNHEWYQYQSFFSECIRHQLAKTDPNAVKNYHQKAHDWWLQNGHIYEALPHAVKSQNTDLIVSSLSACGGSLFQPAYVSVIRHCLEELPEHVIASNHELALLSAWVSTVSQQDATIIRRHLQQAEDYLSQNLTKQQLASVRAEMAVIKAQLAIWDENIDQADDYTSSVLGLVDNDEFSPIRCRALTVLGEIRICKGNYREALHFFRKAERVARRIASVHDVIWSMAQQADIYRHLGQLELSYQVHSTIMDFAKEKGVETIPIMEFAYRTRAQLLWEWHRLSEAKVDCQKALEAGKHFKDYCALPAITELANIALLNNEDQQFNEQVRLLDQYLLERRHHTDWRANAMSVKLWYWLRHETQWAVRDWLESQTFPSNLSNHFWQMHGRNIARGHLILGQYEEAIDKLKLLLEKAEEHHLLLAVSHNALWLAVAYQSLGKKKEALEALKTSVHSAAQSGCISLYLLVENNVGDLLPELIEKSGLEDNTRRHATKVNEFIRRQRSAKSASSSKVPEVVRSTSLTNKEWQVLSHIGEGFSNDQIADKMFVATSTVRSHIKHIYQKLGVHSRQEARKKANELKELMRETGE
ncbi:MAG: HTH-type transcriptional regulator MalT [Kangiellaceae bacterium]|nr:HTH-type transcriptional regulator MalT [Kangiellaceae bacterium]|tara:strand:- start:5352 stop:8072 length:2721 start_codon:yes stop_codon:yes gene_type:complete